jgi:hypothetical protein
MLRFYPLSGHLTKEDVYTLYISHLCGPFFSRETTFKKKDAESEKGPALRRVSAPKLSLAELI